MAILEDSVEDCPQVVILKAVKVNNDKTHSLFRQIQNLANTKRLVFKWTQAHCGIRGNEKL